MKHTKELKYVNVPRIRPLLYKKLHSLPCFRHVEVAYVGEGSDQTKIAIPDRICRRISGL